ncbi:hypothetical protein JTE90_011001 [Oedothorax gibbosus]|uniref:Coiled-coil domain-containing protein 186 n=1 Tax=Oedothorax gibbosus TaxID=931172 RepID=A0AAV6VED3_9ARAC|nr:hypothetical protein JTE90_011001 [Oedothorax gibbosus]
MAESLPSLENCESYSNSISINSIDSAKPNTESCSNLLVECKTLYLDKENELEHTNIICNPPISLSSNLNEESETDRKSVKIDAQICCTFSKDIHTCEDTEDSTKVKVGECTSPTALKSKDNSLNPLNMHHSSEIVSENSKLKTEALVESHTGDQDNFQSIEETSILNCGQDCVQIADLEIKEILAYHFKEFEAKKSGLENDITNLQMQLKSQELVFKKSELQIRADFLNKIEKLSKECNTLRKEKESIVIRYANSEKDVIMEKKAHQELEKKLREMVKEKDNLISKNKGLLSEINRVTTSYETKMVEIAKLQKNFDRLNGDFNAREIRIKWLQNKLKSETTAHQETQSKLDHTVHRLNEMKEEAEQVRKDCQEMIKCYQEAEEIKSVKLDSQLKLKLTELEVQKQEKSDQEQVYHLLRQELDSLKKKQRVTIEENNSLTLKIQSLEKNRLEYEQNLSKLKDAQNFLKEENVDLTARLAEMETLRLQLEREKEKSAATLREVDRLRSTNAELQADMNACHLKEGELLKFTEGVTDTNVKLQSGYSLLEIKAQALEDELTETKKHLTDIQQKYFQLSVQYESAKKEHEDEVQLLAWKLAEKTKNVEKLNIKLDEAENENRVLKRRHIASIKELSRELCDCKKRLDIVDSNNSIRTESASLGSRSSSTASLDVMNANERVNGVSSPPISTNSKSSANPLQNASPDIPGVDKEMLIERIIKLQKTLARKNDKIDFLEDHIVQLVKEMRKKTKVVDFKTV